MTILQRAANVIRDLQTLGVIEEEDKVRSFVNNFTNSLTIRVESHSVFIPYALYAIEYGMKEEFKEENLTIERKECLEIIFTVQCL